MGCNLCVISHRRPQEHCAYNLTFGYDRCGNGTCQINGSTSGPCPQLTYNTGANQVTGYSYDAAGNLLANGTGVGTQSFTWDAEERMSTMTNNGGGATTNVTHNALVQETQKIFSGYQLQYFYDPLGHHVGTYSAGQNAWWHQIIRLGERVLSYTGGSSFMHVNALNTTTVVTYANGNFASDQLFFPYGQEWQFYSPGQFYGGYFGNMFGESDSPNFYKAQHRMYDQYVGRWLTPDPLPWLEWQHGNEDDEKKFMDFISNPQNLNLYSYVDNNPVSRIDPTGMNGCQAGDKKFETCTITIVYDPKTSKGTLTVTGQNKGDKGPTVLLTGTVVVGGDGHVTPTGKFTASYWERDHVSTRYGTLADTPYSKTILGINAFGPYQLHIKELEGRGIYIHGTIGPNWSPFTFGNVVLGESSHGCIRMCNRDDNALHSLMPDPVGNRILISAEPEDQE